MRCCLASFTQRADGADGKSASDVVEHGPVCIALREQIEEFTRSCIVISIHSRDTQDGVVIVRTWPFGL